MRAVRRLTTPSAGERISVRPSLISSSWRCARIRSCSASASFRPSLWRGKPGARGPVRGLAVIESGLARHAQFTQRLHAIEGVFNLAHRRFAFHDLIADLFDRGLGLRKRRRVLGKLRFEDLAREPGQNLPLFHAVAFLGQEFGQPVSVDLRSDKNFFARDQRAGHQHIIDKGNTFSLHNGDSRGPGLLREFLSGRLLREDAAGAKEEKQRRKSQSRGRTRPKPSPIN